MFETEMCQEGKDEKEGNLNPVFTKGQSLFLFPVLMSSWERECFHDSAAGPLWEDIHPRGGVPNRWICE